MPAPNAALIALVAFSAFALPVSPAAVGAQDTSQQGTAAMVDMRLHDIGTAPDAGRIEADIRTLAGFGTRNTLSDTLSSTRGIGAARRWIKAQFDSISTACGGCLEVSYVASIDTVRGGVVVNVVNVVAIQRGTAHPDRYVMMSGDIDSRASNTLDGETDAPGANDNASGMAGTIEAARVLTKYRFPSSIAYLGLSGEEQGLWGGRAVAAKATAEGWDIAAVLNNDMIGNIRGQDGVVDNRSFRIFSEPRQSGVESSWNTRIYGGEVDGPSRQLARHIARVAEQFVPNVEPMMVYRLDRFGRGGHHRPFNDAGFPGVRIMETHENYIWQHQNIRVENGIEYGDVIEHVNFDYAARLTAVNAVALASLAWAPSAPAAVRIGGAVQPSTTLDWDAVDSPNLAGYKVYWRLTTDPQWRWSHWVPAGTTRFTLQNVVIDNYYFGVAAVSENGNESPVVFPSAQLRRQ
ncbi:MAG TPA: M28 family metallopeptidase [Gemmatimonadales bacterium]|nr:M28 family metallopeptidase [Gemmatimonadales bacterium]